MLNKIAHDVYEHHILKQKQLGTYMDIWHFFQAANVLNRPIQSVIPIRGSSNFRNNFSHIVYPWHGVQRNREALKVMWMPKNVGVIVNHFVPLLKVTEIRIISKYYEPVHAYIY